MEKMFGFFSRNAKIQRTYFVVPTFVLGYLGFWPERKLTIPLFIWQMFNVFCLSVGVFGELHFSIYHRREFRIALDGFATFATKFVTLQKLIYVLIFRKKFKMLVEKVRPILFNETDPEILKNLQIKSSYAALFAYMITMFGMMTNASFALRPIVANILDYTHGRNLSNGLPFQVVVPDSYHHFPRYPILFVTLFYSGFVTGFSFGGTDGIFIGFCGYIATAFEMIQNDLKNVLKDIKYIETKQQSNLYYDKIRSIIIRHDKTIALAKEFSSFTAYNTLIHFASASIVMCISCFMFILGSGVDLAIYGSYVLAVVTQLFVYCLGGNYLLESSWKIGQIIYLSDWYKCDVRIRKMLLMIMIRSARGTGVEIPFFQPSLLLYGSILSTAGSYIALLKTFL